MSALNSTRAERRALQAENLKWPFTLNQIPREQWPRSSLPLSDQPVEVWRSRQFLVQIFKEKDGAVERLTICRTSLAGAEWKGGISWDDLQSLKAQCGRGDKCAVEIFPPDRQVVNVANMRHLWVLPEPPDFIWNAK